MSRNEHRRTFGAACVQFNVERGEPEVNFAAAEAGIEQAKDQGAELIVLPEMWSTSFLPNVTSEIVSRSQKVEERLLELSGCLDLVIIGSALEEARDDDGSIIHFNRARVMDRGTDLGSYRKIHLFSPNAEDRHHTPGATSLVVDSSLGRIGVLICYDLRFPELVRYHFYQGAEILVVPAQWPEARSGHWRILVQARAIENEVFVIGCNRTGQEPSLKNQEMLPFPGDSRLVDPMGEVLAAGTGEEGAVVATIDTRKIDMMHRILPIMRDRRPQVYRDLWDPVLRDQDDGRD